MPARNLWRKRQIILDPELVEKLYSWHGGQNSYVYSLASTGHEHLVSLSMIDAALKELARAFSRAKADKEKEEVRELGDIIGELELIRGYWQEHSAQEAGMDMSEDEYKYDRRDYGSSEEDEKSLAGR